jgi:uncharacterized protein
LLEGNRRNLHRAVRIGDAVAAEALLDDDDDPPYVDCKAGDGSTPLIVAARRGHEATILMLLSRGADTNSQNDRGDTALMFAVRNGLNGAISKLVEQGADVTMTNSAGKTASDLAPNDAIRALLQVRDGGGREGQSLKKGYGGFVVRCFF